MQVPNPWAAAISMQIIVVLGLMFVDDGLND
jgi:hypothetical protein